MTGPTAVVWRGDEDIPASPEFRYLRELMRVQLARVVGDFDEYPWTSVGERAIDEPPGRVLVVGSPRVLFTERSLRAMDGALDAGAGVVVASRLEETEIVARHAIHTLREFELAEAAFLVASDDELTPASGLPPLSLWRGDHMGVIADLASGRTRWDALAEVADLRVRRCGLAHEFIDYYGQAREDVLPHLPAEAGDVLEIGCGRGLTGELLQRRLGCRVTGVELNPVIAREAASRLHRVLCGDFERLELEDRYDAVVATELFEHLVEPIAFLQRVRALLRPGGRAVISTPNVGHYSIVRDLLHGRWDYLPIGLLCYTHLRFFTRATLTNLVAMAGFSRVAIEPQLADLPPEVAGWAEPLGADLESLAATGFWIVAHR